MRSIVLLFAVSLPLLGQTTCTKANFEPGTMSASSLTSEFKGSILRLEVQTNQGSESGTGYLIDSVNGYVITAFHVVENGTQNTSIAVTSPYSTLNGGKLTATLVKSLATGRLADQTLNGPDLAILQLNNPSLVKDLRPVDIRFRYPEVGQDMYAMGYPQSGDQLNKDYAAQSVHVISLPADGSIKVTEAVSEGDSGGPLMDPSGDVVGTCREKSGSPSVTALYVPMSDGMALLDQIPLSDRMKSLDERIRSGSITESELMDILVKNSRNPTNLEWYAWSKYVIAHLGHYTSEDSTSKLLMCAMHALGQRGMEDVVDEVGEETYRFFRRSQGKGSIQSEFFPLVDSKSAGDANVRVAEREIAQGRFLSAEKHAKAATVAYAAANDALGTNRADMIATRIQLAVGSIDAAQSLSTKVLAHLDILPPKDKSTALSLAASIDLERGNRSAAIPKFIAASGYSIAAGQFTTAADLLMSSANASVKLNKLQDAKDSLTTSIALYQRTGDVSGEAEAVFKLVMVDSALGDREASKSNLQHYLALQPQGVHAAEAKDYVDAR